MHCKNIKVEIEYLGTRIETLELEEDFTLCQLRLKNDSRDTDTSSLDKDLAFYKGKISAYKDAMRRLSLYV